ncbi:MAG TPA: chemotaxis protein CheW [Solirubrobacteraceae bacterium]|nr:chemotaxis protein CheW [Solirubrobacteraceae bacterium]
MATAEAERQVVVFSLAGEYYGLPITAVREIIRYVEPSATATARGAIRGMIVLRGRTLPIADLSSRLGQELELGIRTRILVLEVAGGALGLIVDGVDGILPIPADRIEPLPVATGDDGLGHEVAAVGERLIVLIDPERAFGDLLPRKPARAPARRRKTTPARPRASS